jgi:deoxyribodipyrimidine photo-lyase
MRGRSPTETEQHRSKAADAGSPATIVWFRNDLRIADNLALSAACDEGPVVCLYVLDEESRDFRGLGGAQRWWLHHALEALSKKLKALDAPLVLRRGAAADVLDSVIKETGAEKIYWNRRYVPAGMALDTMIKSTLAERGLTVRSFAGHLLHEPSEFQTGAGGPYRVYSPFWRAMNASGEPRSPIDAPDRLTTLSTLPKSDRIENWDLLPKKPDWAGSIAAEWTPGEDGAQARLDDFITRPFNGYKTDRDRPDRDGTSRLSPHLAFGEITPAQIWEASSRRPKEVSEDDRTTFRKEVAWREFSYHLLYHFPDLPRENFNSRFDAMRWSGTDDHFSAWCRGLTGYPIVDAGMRQLWQTGWMHNRVRMIVASFLTKDLMIDWRRGEDWFWDTLVDADHASNAASWQWVAGSGADAAPYFRVFNPMLQGKKFDPDGDYVRTFVPELARLDARHIHQPFDAPADVLKAAGVRLGETYPAPIVDHFKARDRALGAYDQIKESA